MSRVTKTDSDSTRHPVRRTLKAACFLGLLCYMLMSIVQAQEETTDSGSIQSNELPSSDVVTEDRVRKVLLDILEQDKENPSNTTASTTSTNDFAYSEELLSNWQPTETNMLADRLRQLKREWPKIGDELKTAFMLATTPEDGVTGLSLLLTLILLIASGFALEYLATRPLLQRLIDYARSQEKTLALKVKFIFSRLLIQALGLLIFGVATYTAALFFIKKNLYFEMLFLEVLDAFIFFPNFNTAGSQHSFTLFRTSTTHQPRYEFCQTTLLPQCVFFRRLRDLRNGHTVRA